jgi:protein-S-isoprenylcysteine O-methyltransferase Ste14
VATDYLFHALFWAVLGGMLVVRVFSVVQVQRSGARFTPDQRAIEQEGKVAFAIRFVGFFFLLGMLAAYALNPPWMQRLDLRIPSAGRWLGFFLGLAGVGMAGWAQVTLGRQWSAQLQLAEGHRVVTNGPYAWVRHPIYASLAALSLGFALLTANWFFIGFGALAIGMLIVRIPREEKMMREGVRGYPEYAARVRYRILPGVW